MASLGEIGSAGANAVRTDRRIKNTKEQRSMVFSPSQASRATAFAAEPNLTRVYDPPRLPDDPRITKLWHLDAPYAFAPEFKSRSEWQARAQELRTQVLVANGLWPMPEKAPLNPVIHGKIYR